MSLEAVLEANTTAMRELTAALIAAGAIQTAQAPGVDKVVKAQKDLGEKKSKVAPGLPIDTMVTASDPVAATSGEASTSKQAEECADAVELQPWHEKTAALYAELKDKKPELASVQKAILGVNSLINREQATAILQRFGAQAITPKADKKGLDEAQFPDVFAMALEVLAGRRDATDAVVSE